MNAEVANSSLHIDAATYRLLRAIADLARILHEAFYCERCKHGIFGSILEIRARAFQPFTALATKFRAICGLKEANRRHGLRITAKTVDFFWNGEAIDYHMAFDALLSYDDEPIDEE